jgi:hypothetical protein
MNTKETPFKEFILKDTSWMKNLFQNTKICNEHSPLLTDQIPNLLCSEGGLKDSRGGFGLIIQRINK